MPITPEEMVNLTKVISAEVDRQVNERMEQIAPYLQALAESMDRLTNLVMSRAFGSELPATVDRFWRDAVAYEAGRLGILTTPQDAAEPPEEGEGDDEAGEPQEATVSPIEPRPRRRGYR